MTQIIVAFDLNDQQNALKLLDSFPEPIYVKIGMENFYSLGPSFIQEVKARGHHIFLDLKLHDIPNTVSQAMRQLAKLDIDMLNVHASGGIEMMKSAVQAVKSVNPHCLCIAVTLLTSLDEQTLHKELAISSPLLDTTLHYAKNAQSAGLDGVVCSVHEVEKIHRLCGKDFLCVTPGISLSIANYDQKRTASPIEAKQAGSDYIVVGRAITQSAHPYQTYLQIQQELQS